MKKIFRISPFILPVLLLLMAGCEKAEKLPFYGEGKDITLSASSTSIAPVMADSNNSVLNLKWSSPDYPMDSSQVKYIVQVADAGTGFKDAITRELTGRKDTGFLAKELNKYATDHQWEFNKPHNMEARVISSYPNNNDRKYSNTLAFTYTPYLVPPEVTPPASKQLYLVGSATAGGWNNPVPVSQKFTMIDSVTYVGTFYMNGGGQYLLLPVNGDWGHKYNVADANLPGLNGGGDFGADLGGANIPGPDKTGTYKISVDFQHGKFKVEKVNEYGLLYVPGDYQGWNPGAAYALGSPGDNQKFDGYLNVPSGGSYEFKFTKGPNWDNALGDGGGGTLSSGGGNIKFPGGGYYYLQANTNENTFSIKPITSVGVIGSFAGSGWGADVPMTYNATEKRWKATITTVAGDQFKFRMNGSWDLNYGEDGQGGLKQGGDNIGDAGKNYAVPAGTHTIYLYLDNSGYYTYSIQ